MSLQAQLLSRSMRGHVSGPRVPSVAVAPGGHFTARPGNGGAYRACVSTASFSSHKSTFCADWGTYTT